MQIVVNLDEKIWEILKNPNKFATMQTARTVCEAVENGIVLPKGHGDLKDIGECDRKLFYQQCGGADSLITVKTAFDMFLLLPTIIEADKGSEE